MLITQWPFFTTFLWNVTSSHQFSAIPLLLQLPGQCLNVHLQILLVSLCRGNGVIEMGSSRLLTFIDQCGQFIQLTNKITVFSQLYSHALNHAPNRSFVVDLKTGTNVF